MLNINCDKLTNISKAIKNYKSCGVNIPIYLNKADSYLTKDRVAASFISDDAFKLDTQCNSTLIKATNGMGKDILFTSDISLTYEALISLIYELRLEGFTVTDIGNISIGDGNQIVSVGELHTDTNVIKVSVSDEFRGLVVSLIEEHSYRDKERHTSKIAKVIVSNGQRCVNKAVQIALKQSFDEIAEFNIKTNAGDKYNIYESTNILCVIHKSGLLFISTSKGVDIDNFITNLKDQLSIEKKKCNIRTTNEIIMF